MKTHLYTILLLLSAYQQVSAREPNPISAKANLSFITNTGQVTDQHLNPRKDIDYKLNAPGINIFIGDGQIHYQWVKNHDLGGFKDGLADIVSEKNTNEPGQSINLKNPGSKPIEIYRLDVSLIGANKNAEVIASDQQPYYERYYLDHMETNGAIAHSYNKITYKDIYPNIDWVLYTKDNQLKYDFIVRPGGNVADIKIKYDGATSLNIEDGALTATTPFGSITEQKPYSYEANTKQPINTQYILEDNILRFATANYAGTLVIDPALDWATYYGGAGEELCYAVSTDPNNNLYICGFTESSNNIATAGAFQSIINTALSSNGFLAKFNNMGQRLWGTYFLGNGWDVACDATGIVYITASAFTGSNLVTVGTHQPINNGDLDAILARFDGTGQRIWGTYYGGAGIDYGLRLAVDPAGAVYLAGSTQSSSGIATLGTHQTVIAGTWSAFLAKFTNTGQRLWGTYFVGTVGGAAARFSTGLACSPAGDVYLAGSTGSTTGIATPGSHQTALAGNLDHYLVRFTSTGQRVWGTYYGGTGDEYEMNMTTDASGNIYLLGGTESTGGIATPGSYQPVFAGGIQDAYLAKFNRNGQRLWATYYGGTGFERTMGITFDKARNIYLSGSTNSSSGIATPGAYQTTLNSLYDAFLVKFSPGGQPLWASYFGGNMDESFENALVSDATGSIYLAGVTGSTSGIATPGSHQQVYGGDVADAFLARFRNEDTLVYIPFAFADTLLCPLDTVHVPYELTYNFRTNNTFTLQLSDATGSFAAPVNIGTVAANTPGILNGVIPAGTPAGSGYRIRIIASGPADTSLWRSIRIKPRPNKPTATSNTPVCAGQGISLFGNSSTPGVSYSWSGPGSYSSTAQNPTRANATPAMAGNYIVKTILNGCSSEADTATVVINPLPPAPTAGSNSPICAGTSLNLTASTIPGVSYNWSGPAFTSNLQNPVINPAPAGAAGVYSVNVTDANGCTSATATTNVTINTGVTPSVGAFPNPNDTVCPGATVTFVAVPSNGGTPQYQWYKNSLQVPGATNPVYITNTVSTGDFYSVEMTSTASCAVPATVSSSNIIMTVVPPVVPSVTITASPGLNVGPWREITFTATPVNGGPSPTYQWLRNGQPVIGAISDTWGANNLSDNDVISVVLFSSAPCAIPPTDTSNTQTVHINLGIGDKDNSTKLQLYPNPNTGDFTIKGNINTGTVHIDVVNAIGQTVYSEQRTVNNEQFEQVVHLDAAAGIYLLKLTTEQGTETTRFRIE